MAQKEVVKYDMVFKDEAYRSLAASQGIRYVAKVCTDLKFKSVLDVGCGPGFSVMEFLVRGHKTQGVEPCEYLHKNELRVPSALGVVKKAQIISIPFALESFDLVFCTDVLEHLPEDEVHKAISELIRVSKKYVYVTICSHEAVCFPELKLHQTVKPKDWWDIEFGKFKVKKRQYGEENEYLYCKL